jgi:chromosome segregation ATPase
MQYVSIRDFAKSHFVTYEAIRKSVIRYREELSGHIIRKDGCQYLDEEAVKFLEEHRRQYRVVEIREDQGETIKEKENEIAELQKRLDVYRDEIIELQKRNIDLIEESRKYTAFLQDRDRLQAEHDKAIADRETAEAAAKTAQAEVETVRADAETARAEAAAAQADLDRIRTEAETTKADLEKIRTELQVVQTEASSYYRTFFGFYRKKS